MPVTAKKPEVLATDEPCPSCHTLMEIFYDRDAECERLFCPECWESIRLPEQVRSPR